jgi:sirohydrochlorin cobaltochelatase
MSTTRSIDPKAPAIRRLPDDAALLICAHGIRGSPGMAELHADALRRRGVAPEVETCCLRGQPSVAQAIAELSASTIMIVPLLMADGHAMQVLSASAQRDMTPDRTSIILCQPIGMHVGLADIICTRAARACQCRGWATEETALVLVGHGTNRTLRSGSTAHRHAAAIRHRRAFATVSVAFLDMPPSLPEVLSRGGYRNTVVVGLFADRGVHGEDDVLGLLAMSFGGSVVYDGPIGTAPEVADVILDQARFAGIDPVRRIGAWRERASPLLARAADPAVA